jgi:hypothetical protein
MWTFEWSQPSQTHALEEILYYATIQFVNICN